MKNLRIPRGVLQLALLALATCAIPIAQAITFEVNTTEQQPPEFGGGTVGYGALVRGQGYVQFCLTSNSNEDLFIADMTFHKVK